MKGLSEADKDKITAVIKPALGKLEDRYAELLWLPGLGDKIKSAMKKDLDQVASLGNLSLSNLPDVSGDLADTFTSLTKTLTGVKDAATAEEAAEKLKKINDKLDDAPAKLKDLSTGGKSILVKLIKAAIAKLGEVYDNVVKLKDVSGKLKPAMDPIMTKLKALVE
jgi:hypothetical protein